MAAFNPTSITRGRTVAWGVKKPGEKPGAITSVDLQDDNGKVDLEACKRFGVNPDVVRDITINDLPAEYAKGVKDALTKMAAEWSVGAKDENDKPVRWTPDDVAYYLVLQSRMQDAANETIKQHRPVSDKALDRATSAIVKNMKSAGKTIDEVLSTFKMMGTKFNETDIRSTYGT